jgi:hypothetical protein
MSQIICPECNGRGGHYADTGPAPKFETCSKCDGACTWEEEDRCDGCDEPLVVGGPADGTCPSCDGQFGLGA